MVRWHTITKHNGNDQTGMFYSRITALGIWIDHYQSLVFWKYQDR
jgi:hypothetical protein